MKYYNFETLFDWLANNIREYLHANNIYYELSKNGRLYHFEILTDPAGADVINGAIDIFREVKGV